MKFEAQIVEAIGQEEGKTPTSWRVRLLDQGMSKNGAMYSRSVLEKAVNDGIFEGVRALARSDSEHIKNTEVRTKNLAGWFRDVKMGASGVEGVFEAEEPWVAEKLWRSWQKGKKDYFGFSIIGEAAFVLKRNAQRVYRDIQSIRKIDFVDVVVNPSAGGGVISLAEANSPNAGRQNSMNTLEKLLKLIEEKAPEQYKSLDLNNISEAEVMVIAEALMDAKSPKEEPKEKVEKITEAKEEKIDIAAAIAEGIAQGTKGMAEEFARQRGEEMLTSFIAESKLPVAASRRIWAMMPTDRPWTSTMIREAIRGEEEYIRANRFKGAGSTTHVAAIVEGGMDELDKWNAAMAGFFSGHSERPLGDEKQALVPAFRSIKEAYIGLTGDVHITGEVSEATKVGAIGESTIDSTTWSGALGDHLHKAMQKEYAKSPYDQYKAIANEVAVSDFRLNYRPQMGGFSNLPVVLEKGDYVDASAAPDDTTTVPPQYQVTKYGNIQPVTMETIINDDVGAVKRLPGKFARAGQRTLNEKAWYPILNNSNVSYEAVALFAAGHGANITTGAMTDANIAAARVTMMKQTEAQSGERLNIPPRYLACSIENQKQAFEICYSAGKPLLAGTSSNDAADTPSTSTIENAGMPNFYRTFNLEPLVIPHSTDMDAWFMFADKNDIDILEIGYLNGKDQPELFVQDGASNGSMFTNDQITYKLRFIFGVCVLDHRGAFGGLPV